MKAKMYRRWIHADKAERGLFNCPFRGEECTGESCPLWLEHPEYDVYGTCTLSPSLEFDAEEHPFPWIEEEEERAKRAKAEGTQ